VYSLGLTLYELVTLQPAFADQPRAGLIDAILNQPLTAPRLLCPSIPRDLETIVLKSVAHETADRYATAGELAEDLQCFLADRPIHARRVTLRESMWRWSRRNPALAALTGTAALLLLTVAVVASAAYVHTSRANEEVKDALASAEEAQRRAEETSELALEAIDTIFDELAPVRASSLGNLTTGDTTDEEISVPIQPVLSKETARLLAHMLGFYERLAEQESDDAALRRKIGDAHRRVGDIYDRLGNPAEACAAYERALSVYDQLRGQGSDVVVIDVARARVYNALGSTLATNERPEEAGAAFEQARGILEDAIGTERDMPEVAYEMARTLYLLGREPRFAVPPPQAGGRPPRLPFFEGGPPGMPPLREGGVGPGRMDARERGQHLREAITLLTGLTDAHSSNPEYRHLLALCYREMPGGPPRPGGTPRGGDREEAIRLLEALVKEYPGVPEYRFDLCEAYAQVDRMGPLRRGRDRAEEGEQLNKALGILEALVAERPNVPVYAHSLAHVHHKLARVLRHERQHAEAARHLRQALGIQESLAGRYPDVLSYQMGVALFRITLAEDVSRDDPAAGSEVLEETITELSALRDEEDVPDYVTDLAAHAYRVLARCYREQGQRALAAEAMQEARRLREHRPRRPREP
jgi:tetratricopeptide (TPR) repeat protein